MRRSYRGNIANEINMLGVYNLCDEVRCHCWSVSVNILFVGVDSRILRTGVLRDRQWEARG